MKKILFTAPVYISNQQHFDFVKETMDSLKTHKNEFAIMLIENYIADEFKEQIYNTYPIYPNPEGNNVSAAWNAGLVYGFSNFFDYVIVGNLDIILREDTIDNLVEFAEKNKKDTVVWTSAEWTNRRTIHSLEIKKNKNKLKILAGGEEHDWEAFDEHPHFSLFMVSRDSIKKLWETEYQTAEPVPGYFDVGYNKAYFEDQDFHQRILRAGLKAYKCNSSIFYHYGSRTIKSDAQLDMENAHSYESNRKYFEDKWGYDSHDKVPSNKERVKLGYETAFDKGTGSIEASVTS